MRNKTKGSLTVEATIVMPIYIMAIMTIISLLNIFYTKTVIQQAINNSATKVAEYTYVVKAIGYLDDAADMYNLTGDTSTKLNDTKSGMDKVKQDANNVVRILDEGISFSNLDDLYDSISDFCDSTKDLGETLSSVDMDNIQDLIFSEASNAGTGYVIGFLTENYISDMKLDVTDISDRDYSNSKFLQGDNKDIIIVVTYTYKNPLSMKFFKDIKIAQMVVVHPWIGDDSSIEAAVNAIKNKADD